MKAINIFKIYIFVAFVFMLSCNKDDTPIIETPLIPQQPPIAQGDMWACHNTVSWDSLKTIDSLIGAWDWEFISCFWHTEDANYEDYKGLSVDFKADMTLDVSMNGQVTQTATWQILNDADNVFVIKIEPIVPQIYGRILFCNGRVEFYDSYIDGCDNYFKRK